MCKASKGKEASKTYHIRSVAFCMITVARLTTNPLAAITVLTCRHAVAVMECELEEGTLHVTAARCRHATVLGGKVCPWSLKMSISVTRALHLNHCATWYVAVRYDMGSTLILWPLGSRLRLLGFKLLWSPSPIRDDAAVGRRWSAQQVSSGSGVDTFPMPVFAERCMQLCSKLLNTALLHKAHIETVLCALWLTSL